MSTTIPVATVQRGLTVWYYNAPTDAPRASPGPVDGLWGPRTRRALEVFVRHVGPQREPPVSWALTLEDLGTPVARASEISVPARVAEDLFQLSRSYAGLQEHLREQAPPPPVASMAPLPIQSPSLVPVILGTVVGAGVIGGVLWYLTRE